MLTIRSYAAVTEYETELQFRLIASSPSPVRDMHADGTWTDYSWAGALDRFMPVHVLPQAWILDDDVNETRNPHVFEFNGTLLVQLIEGMSWPRIELHTFSTPEVFLDAVDALNGQKPFLVSFDHDLRSEITGSHCARALCERLRDTGDIPPPEYIVHSANPEGARNIISHMETYRKYLSLK